MYKALEDPTASPLKKPKIECASDDIIQEVAFVLLLMLNCISAVALFKRSEICRLLHVLFDKQVH